MTDKADAGPAVMAAGAHWITSTAATARQACCILSWRRMFPGADRKQHKTRSRPAPGRLPPLAWFEHPQARMVQRWCCFQFIAAGRDAHQRAKSWRYAFQRRPSYRAEIIRLVLTTQARRPCLEDARHRAPVSVAVDENLAQPRPGINPENFIAVDQGGKRRQMAVIKRSLPPDDITPALAVRTPVA